MRSAPIALAGVLIAGAAASVATAENRIDVIRPDAPELAAFGAHPVGVRTVELSNPDQIDILSITETTSPDALPRYDRPLTVEVWYPAAADAGRGGEYRVILRDGATEATVHGMAVRDAAPSSAGPFPLAIISHGYPGNRFLMSHLGENLASKGYVVASIDHTDSMYHDQAAFGSTLVNRPLDQKFVLDEMARMGAEGGAFAGLVDASRTGLIGYSMGGYGAIISAGGGVAPSGVNLGWGAPMGTLGVHLAGSDSHEALIDDRVKAVVAIGPWGINYGFWDEIGLAEVRKPMLYVAGSVDDVSGYDPGVRTIWENSAGAERWLLTFDNANHNAAAPMPAPAESWAPVDNLDFIPFDHYADAVWDTTRMNNILQHFATAFLDWQVKGEAGKAAYLDLVPSANDAVNALNEDGSPKPEHTQWKGFAPRTAKGLRLEHMAKE